MKYLTEDLYKKMQLFQLPLQDGFTFEDLEELFEIDVHEFLMQELMAHDQWYDKYLPEELHSRLFDKKGEISFQELDDDLLDMIRQFRSSVEFEWSKAMAKAKQNRQQVRKTASPALRKLLDMNLAESEVRMIRGIDSREVTMEVYPQWDLSKKLLLQFKGVKGGWASKLHPDDADWWLADEIFADEERENAYQFHMMFGNAESVGLVQLSFTEVEIYEQDDVFDF
ncbi:MAG: DUF4085 family protein [Peptococcaceae bacterium]|nr:DUF4085 family protein [Peptococcaceae bacterium]MBO5140184.1 DUF4085 family protein [Peptococcaceae bacterium]MBO5300680.1 DUF4085 family protein [Peptococcaceae bacterium]MBO5429392.1 DUF4085 family protein [Peptococcaceae bacterium]MBP3342650.1 DUF4085 family protein [Peptococcaceae bacterium]